MQPEPQAVLSPLTGAAVFLALTVGAGGEDTVRELLPDLAGLRRSVGFRAPDAGLTCVTGIGSDLWDRLFDGPRPAALHPFRELAGPRHRAPATPGDLLLHLRAERMDLCFELASQLTGRLAGAATVVDSVQGFRYFDDRDLLGFVDGTENPEGRAAEAAAVVGAEDPEFAGGSYVVVQKYLHDLDKWNALSVEDQERAVGRTKLTDIELADDVKPADSHVALTVITGPDGEERKIVRFNMAFGSFQGGGEFGTYFIGYARDPAVTEEMLRKMFIGDPPGTTDRLLDFSTAVTGSLFFVPTADFLDSPPPAPASAPAAVAVPAAGPADAPAAGPAAGDAGTTVAAPADGSLGIGSLRPTP
ncbi:Dyp-type peroxidase [Kitasatospora sp. NPDC048194]|uniref:Dyp-type peroxidase n=1 Tax=Kitasatospora sp. NPDC048194 TaxID=3364045 RepID=UPI0037189F11